jgi:hypothetical protein
MYQIQQKFFFGGLVKISFQLKIIYCEEEWLRRMCVSCARERPKRRGMCYGIAHHPGMSEVCVKKEFKKAL